MKYTAIQIDAIAAYLLAEFPEQVLAILEQGNPSTTIVIRHTGGERHDVVMNQEFPPSAEACTEVCQELNLAGVMREHKDERVRVLVKEEGITVEPLTRLKTIRRRS